MNLYDFLKCNTRGVLYKKEKKKEKEEALKESQKVTFSHSVKVDSVDNDSWTLMEKTAWTFC